MHRVESLTETFIAATCVAKQINAFRTQLQILHVSDASIQDILKQEIKVSNGKTVLFICSESYTPVTALMSSN